MNRFFENLSYVQERLYKPNGLIVSNEKEEPQNKEYGAGIFHLNSKTIRFRVAKITPTKIGQFVAFWEKDEHNKNQAYSIKSATDLLVITTIDGQHMGQFVFPKDILIKKNILKAKTSKGKMAIRVYPSWEKPTSKQAINTQQWQLEYFVEVNEKSRELASRILKLYTV